MICQRFVDPEGYTHYLMIVKFHEKYDPEHNPEHAKQRMQNVLDAVCAGYTDIEQVELVDKNYTDPDIQAYLALLAE